MLEVYILRLVVMEILEVRHHLIQLDGLYLPHQEILAQQGKGQLVMLAQQVMLEQQVILVQQVHSVLARSPGLLELEQKS